MNKVTSNMDFAKHHTIYLIVIVVLVVLFVIAFLALSFGKEQFTNTSNEDSSLSSSSFFSSYNHETKEKDKHKHKHKGLKTSFTDYYVPQNLKFWDLTDKYKPFLKGTSIANVSAIESNRFPAIIDTTTNWYNTEGLCCV